MMRRSMTKSSESSDDAPRTPSKATAYVVDDQQPSTSSSTVKRPAVPSKHRMTTRRKLHLNYKTFDIAGMRHVKQEPELMIEPSTSDEAASDNEVVNIEDFLGFDGFDSPPAYVDEIVHDEPVVEGGLPVTPPESVVAPLSDHEEDYAEDVVPIDLTARANVSDDEAEPVGPPVQIGGGSTRDPCERPEYIRLVRTYDVYIQRFHTTSVRYEFRFNETFNNDHVHTFRDFLLAGFSELLDCVTEHVHPHDYIGLTIDLADTNFNPIGLSFRQAIELHPEMILDLLASVSQSNKFFSYTSLFIITVTVVKGVVGGAPVNSEFVKYDDVRLLQAKVRSIAHDGVSADNLCLPKAILLGIAHITDNQADLLAYANAATLSAAARRVMAHARQTVTVSGCRISVVYAIQKLVFPHFVIRVYDKGCGKNGNCHLIRTVGNGPVINLFYFHQLTHYVYITNRSMFFDKAECVLCGFMYVHTHNHFCKSRCLLCRGNVDCGRRTNHRPMSLTCARCNRRFYDQLCFDAHTVQRYRNNLSLCELLKSCPRCSKVITGTVSPVQLSAHMCNEKHCTLCNRRVPAAHQCYVKPYITKPLGTAKMLFFDMECRQEMNTETIRRHTPNLIVSQQVCEYCIELARDNVHYQCRRCQTNSLSYWWTDARRSCVTKFLLHLLGLNVKVTAIAHNLKSYDGHFLMSELSHLSYPVEVTMNGWKIMRLEFKGIRIVDSLNFLQMPLSSFSKVFTLPDNLEKPFFPHLFNTLANEDYAGPMPGREYFLTQHLTSRQLTEFDNWYAKIAPNYRFVLHDELLDYCIADVTILRMGILRFISFFRSVLNVNPVLEATTLPSALMLGFRATFLRPATIGIVPLDNYRPGKLQSKIGRQWLESVFRQLKHIQYEYKLPNVGLYVDGFVPDFTGKTPGLVLEFYGCYWHGHRHCYKDHGVLNRKAQELFWARSESTDDRNSRITAAGYKLVVQWECFFRAQLQRDRTLRNSLQTLTLVDEPLNPRNAVYGGLVEAYKTYHKCAPDERILSLDFKSMYPYVMKTGSYPVGHPKIHRGHADCQSINLDTVCGIIRCRVLPPRQLLLPVLPVKTDTKLIMGLCRTCIERAQPVPCTHTDVDRSIRGVWSCAEVGYAVQKGYTILNIDELWEYNSETYNPQTRTGGLFTEYLDLFMRIKESSSGWPRAGMTPQEKAAYIHAFFVREGIQLNECDITSDEAKRTLSKLMLNCLWGKFIERNDRLKTDIFTVPQKFFEHIGKPDVQVTSIYPWGIKGVYVVWRTLDETQLTPLKHQSVPIGILTTGYGRILLHKALTVCAANGLQLLYCDTDGLQCVAKIGQPLPPELPLGDGVGELTDVFVKEYGVGSYGSEFACMGPKTYGNVIVTPTGTIEVNKCKGISAVYGERCNFNFATMRDMVVKNIPSSLTVTNPDKIKRKPFFIVVTEEEKNEFKLRMIKDLY